MQTREGGSGFITCLLHPRGGVCALFDIRGYEIGLISRVCMIIGLGGGGWVRRVWIGRFIVGRRNICSGGIHTLAEYSMIRV